MWPWCVQAWPTHLHPKELDLGLVKIFSDGQETRFRTRPSVSRACSQYVPTVCPSLGADLRSDPAGRRLSLGLRHYAGPALGGAARPPSNDRGGALNRGGGAKRCHGGGRGRWSPWDEGRMCLRLSRWRARCPATVMNIMTYCEHRGATHPESPQTCPCSVSNSESAQCRRAGLLWETLTP